MIFSDVKEMNYVFFTQITRFVCFFINEHHQNNEKLL